MMTKHLVTRPRLNVKCSELINPASPEEQRRVNGHVISTRGRDVIIPVSKSGNEERFFSTPPLQIFKQAHIFSVTQDQYM